MKKRTILLAAVLLVFAAFLWRGFATYAAQTTQIPLAGSAIPQWVDQLPFLKVVPGDQGAIELRMTEFKSNILPAGAVAGYAGTTVWGYLDAATQFNGLNPDPATIPSYIGPVVVAKRGIATEIKFVNNLGTVGASNMTFWKFATDQTLHWADPLNSEQNWFMKDMKNQPGGFWNFGSDGAMNYGQINAAAPIPAVVHLHGGEVPPVLDGGPDAWFTYNGLGGHGYWNLGGPQGGTPPGNYATYRYPNTQEAANIWFHDHALGITRLNVYAGMAGAYVLLDPHGSNVNFPAPANLPMGRPIPGTTGVFEHLIPLAIQDRMFDMNGELFFPADSAGGVLWTPNPEHPYWVPEFLGDTIVVSGKSWPTIGTALPGQGLEAKRYRFLFLNGSNARTYELFLVDQVTNLPGPPLWVIGTDGGYLDSPVKIDPAAAVNNKLVIMPGERYDVIIDFAQSPNSTLIMRNIGRSPYPKGAAPNGKTLGQIVKIFVGAPPAAADTSYNPALLPRQPGYLPLRSTPLVRLPGAPAGPVIPTPAVRGGVVDEVRQLTLNEVMGLPKTVTDPVTGVALTAYPGGPLEVLLNNTKYSGRGEDSSVDAPATNLTFSPLSGGTGFGNVYYSEFPVEGKTEVWEIVNLTADAHPIHLHLVQFQLISRQNFNVNNYNAVYNASFPGMAFIGGYGPPLDYLIGNARALGGNPDIYAVSKTGKPVYLQGPVNPPLPQEAGWKDTVTVYPGQVTRLSVRWAPTDLALNTPMSQLHFPFDPDDGHGYVWHCHIIDHEDNEMMRPNRVELNPVAPAPNARPLKKGIDY